MEQKSRIISRCQESIRSLSARYGGLSRSFLERHRSSVERDSLPAKEKPPLEVLFSQVKRQVIHRHWSGIGPWSTKRVFPKSSPRPATPPNIPLHQEAAGYGLRPCRCLFSDGLASINARIASRWLCTSSRKASTVGDIGPPRRQLNRNSTGAEAGSNQQNRNKPTRWYSCNKAGRNGSVAAPRI